MKLTEGLAGLAVDTGSEALSGAALAAARKMLLDPPARQTPVPAGWPAYSGKAHVVIVHMKDGRTIDALDEQASVDGLVELLCPERLRRYASEHRLTGTDRYESRPRRRTHRSASRPPRAGGGRLVRAGAQDAAARRGCRAARP